MPATVQTFRQTAGVYTLTLYPELGPRYTFQADRGAAGWHLSTLTGETRGRFATLRACKARVVELSAAAAAAAFPRDAG